jgi:hypothetical protein
MHTLYIKPKYGTATLLKRDLRKAGAIVTNLNRHRCFLVGYVDNDDNINQILRQYHITVLRHLRPRRATNMCKNCICRKSNPTKCLGTPQLEFDAGHDYAFKLNTLGAKKQFIPNLSCSKRITLEEYVRDQIHKKINSIAKHYPNVKIDFRVDHDSVYISCRCFKTYEFSVDFEEKIKALLRGMQNG